MPTTTRRTIITALAACLLLAWPAAAASAAPEGYDAQDHGVGRFYGNFQQDVLLFTGDGVEDICTGGPEPVVSARVFSSQDGTVQVKVNARDVPIVLYRSPLGAPEFIDETCSLLFDGDPQTAPVQPFARGTASLKERITIAPDGIETHFNGVNGFATDTEGPMWKVRTWADFVVDNGVLLGDPAEFQGLAIHRIGP